MLNQSFHEVSGTVSFHHRGCADECDTDVWSCRFWGLYAAAHSSAAGSSKCCASLETKLKLSKGRWTAGECHIWTASTASPFLWRHKAGKAECGWSRLTFPCLCLVMQQPWQWKVLLQTAALEGYLQWKKNLQWKEKDQHNLVNDLNLPGSRMFFRWKRKWGTSCVYDVLEGDKIFSL